MPSPPQTVDIEVVRVRSRKTIERADVWELIVCGAEMVFGGLADADWIYQEIRREIGNPKWGIFIAPEKEPKALAVAVLPQSAFSLYPQIVLAYNEGPRGLAVAVGKRMREWLMSCDFDRTMAHNLCHSERAFLRGFGHFGKPSRFGSVALFDLGVP